MLRQTQSSQHLPCLSHHSNCSLLYCIKSAFKYHKISKMLCTMCTISKHYSPFILAVIRSIWYELLPWLNEFVPGWNEFLPGFSGIYIKFQKNNFFVFKDREVILSEINSHNCSRIFPRGLHIKFQKTLVRIHSILVRIHSILERIRTKWNELLPK